MYAMIQTKRQPKSQEQCILEQALGEYIYGHREEKEIYSDTQKELKSTQGSDKDAVQHDTKCNIKRNREGIKYITQNRFPRKKCDTARYKTNGREEI
jgi:hypothetical protein